MLHTGGKLSTSPRFIVFEGINGAGKSTLIRLLAATLERPCLTSFEPGATELGKTIRSIVLGQNSGQTRVASTTELLLFAADRSEHVSTVIEPALSEGKTVLCDRYLYSTLAFQGHGRGLPMPLVEQVCTIGSQGRNADLVVLLDIDVDTALARTKRRQGDKDAFEEEERAFHDRIRSGFLTIARERPEPFLVLSAAEAPETLLSQLIAVL